MTFWLVHHDFQGLTENLIEVFSVTLIVNLGAVSVRARRFLFSVQSLVYERNFLLEVKRHPECYMSRFML